MQLATDTQKDYTWDRPTLHSCHGNYIWMTTSSLTSRRRPWQTARNRKKSNKNAALSLVIDKSIERKGQQDLYPCVPLHWVERKNNYLGSTESHSKAETFPADRIFQVMGYLQIWNTVADSTDCSPYFGSAWLRSNWPHALWWTGEPESPWLKDKGVKVSWKIFRKVVSKPKSAR